MEAFNYKLDELRIASKKVACLDLMERIRSRCLGLDADMWAFTSGQVFGEYLQELALEEEKLKNGAQLR